MRRLAGASPASLDLCAPFSSRTFAAGGPAAKFGCIFAVSALSRFRQDGKKADTRQKFPGGIGKITALRRHRKSSPNTQIVPAFCRRKGRITSTGPGASMFRLFLRKKLLQGDGL